MLSSSIHKIRKNIQLTESLEIGKRIVRGRMKSNRFLERDTISATNPQMNGPPRSLVAGYESDINRGQPFQDCSNSFRPVINL